MTDLHAGHFGAVQLLFTYISHKVLQYVQGHLQSTLLSSLGLPAALRNIIVSSNQTIDSAEVSTLLVMRPLLVDIVGIHGFIKRVSLSLNS